MVSQSVKVMWDYDAFPLWVSAGPLGQTSSSSVPISTHLSSDLAEWSDELTAVMWGPKGPDDPGWEGPSAADISRLDEVGLQLARRVRAELDSRWSVSYMPTDSKHEMELPKVVERNERRHGR